MRFLSIPAIFKIACSQKLACDLGSCLLKMFTRTVCTYACAIFHAHNTTALYKKQAQVPWYNTSTITTLRERFPTPHLVTSRAYPWALALMGGSLKETWTPSAVNNVSLLDFCDNVSVADWMQGDQEHHIIMRTLLSESQNMSCSRAAFQVRPN